MLIHCGALTNGKLSAEDLPDAVKDAADFRHLIRAIASKHCAQSEHLLPLVKFLTSKLPDTEDFLSILQQQGEDKFSNPQVFTFLAIHVSKNEPVMEFML